MSAVEPSSLAINSHGDVVYRLSALINGGVDSTRLQQAEIIDARPESESR